MYYFTCTLFLVSATITEFAIRCTTKIVHIIWTTISHFDVCWPITAVTTIMKTHRPGDLTVCYCGVSTIQPPSCISATSVCRWTWSWHSCSGWPLETKPTRSDSTVTIIAASSVRNLSVTAVKTSVILTFWYTKKKTAIIIIIMEDRHKILISARRNTRPVYNGQFLKFTRSLIRTPLKMDNGHFSVSRTNSHTLY